MAGEIVTKSKRFYCVSIFPDICLTPLGSTMVPVPYVIIGEFSEATGVSPNITSNGEPVVIHASTMVPSVRGDEPGTGKGIKSGTVGGRVQAMEKSSTLSFNGERAVRVGDLVYMNDKNTIGKVFERLDASALKAFTKAAEPGGTLAVLTEALEARSFISSALLNLVPGGPLISTALSAAAQAVKVSQTVFVVSSARQTVGGSGQTVNANSATLHSVIARDGGVSRGRGKGVHTKVALFDPAAEFLPNDPLCTMPPMAPTTEEIAARNKILHGPQMQVESGDGLSPIQRYLNDSDILYSSPLGAGAYGVSKELGASERAADHAKMLGYSVDVVGGAATGGGMLRPRPIHVAPKGVGENASSGIRFGPKTLIGPGNTENVRGITRENESAIILAKKGYVVEQNPVVSGRKKPDFRINGEIYDNMAPSTSNPYSILTTARDKVLNGQAPNIVINLKDSAATVQSIHDVFEKNPLPDGGAVIIIDKFENVSTIRGR
jgi:hypothetical protein